MSDSPVDWLDADYLGYIVLTLQPDGTWQDDWDGYVHSRRVEANATLTHAETVLGSGHALLVGLTPVGPARSRLVTNPTHACEDCDCNEQAEQIGLIHRNAL